MRCNLVGLVQYSMYITDSYIVMLSSCLYVLQVATVQDSPLDFYHSRIPKKERKRTIVDELLADAEFRK